jgi:MFS transporter, PPP family, 3-phenylpropionic acid transporter
VLAAIPAAVTIVGSPAWGLLADRIGDVRLPILAAASLTIAVALLLAQGPPIALLFPGVGLLAVGTSAMAPLLDARTVVALGAARDRYGQARAFGSLGFIVVSIAVGAIVATHGPRAMFAVFVPLIAAAAVVVVASFGSSHDRGRVAGVGPLRAFGLLRERPFGLYFAGSVIVWTACNGPSSYFSLRLVAQGGDAGLIGLGWAVNALVEIPSMIVFGRLARRTGVPALITIGAAALVVRNLGWALAGSAEASVAVASLSGVGFSLFLVGTTSWLAARVPVPQRATAQALFLGTAYAIGTIAGSLAAGVIAAAADLGIMFAVAAACSAAGAAIAWVAVGRPGLRRSTGPAAGATAA